MSETASSAIRHTVPFLRTAVGPKPVDNSSHSFWMFSKVGASERVLLLDAFARRYADPEFPVNPLILGIGVVPSPESYALRRRLRNLEGTAGVYFTPVLFYLDQSVTLESPSPFLCRTVSRNCEPSLPPRRRQELLSTCFSEPSVSR